MLFEKSIYDLTFDHIKEFCGTNDEGYRVEYKSNFDLNVRRNIPKIVSSFANSHGGVLILGVETDGNTPNFPINGFERPEHEEIRLTLQNICRANIYPSIFPSIKEIATEETNHIIVIISIEESIEAPHAIENSRKVYRRTGDASTPHDLAHINDIKDLFDRRKNALNQFNKIQEQSNKYFKEFQAFGNYVPYLSIIVSPLFPKNPIANKKQIYVFCRHLRLDGPGHAQNRFEINNLWRVNNGVISYNASRYYYYIHENGFINFILKTKLIERSLNDNQTQTINDELNFAEQCIELIYFLQLIIELYQSYKWEGNIVIEMELQNIKGKRLNLFDPDIDNNKSLEESTHSRLETSLFDLSNKISSITAQILMNISWVFNQYIDNFNIENIETKVDNIIKINRIDL